MSAAPPGVGVRPVSVRLPATAWAVVLAGVSASLHLGKLPPAIPALQATLGIGWVEAGFMLSLVQVAGMTLGIGVGLAADAIGLRRSMLIGLTVLGVASLLGGLVGFFAGGGRAAVNALLVLRAFEGAGFLLAVMPAPGLIRALAPPGTEKKAMGLWGAYMPLGVALALLFGPLLIAAVGWAGWWCLLALVSLAAAVWLAVGVPSDVRRLAGQSPGPQHRSAPTPWVDRLRQTVQAPGPWRVAMGFAVYAAQWIAVIGFLPAIYAGAGVPVGWGAVLTACAAATNILGNLVGGWLLQRGVPVDRLLRWGFVAMALGSIAAFAQWGQGSEAIGLPPALRYLAVCLFSLAGGVIPATLFSLAVRLAPGPSTVSTTVGLVQQASALGQFVAPPAVAWLAHRVGGWHWTWGVTVGCSLIGVVLAAGLARQSALRETA